MEGSDSLSSRDDKIILGDYKLEHTIGKGTFGKVKLAANLKTNEKVAIKIIDKSLIISKDEMDRIVKEMNYLKSLDHNNVIKVIEVINKLNKDFRESK
jgi:serine/threonine protein kinase